MKLGIRSKQSDSKRAKSNSHTRRRLYKHFANVSRAEIIIKASFQTCLIAKTTIEFGHELIAVCTWQMQLISAINIKQYSNDAKLLTSLTLVDTHLRQDFTTAKSEAKTDLTRRR